MGKQRVSSLDIAVTVKELQPVVGMRLQNIYDLTPRMYLMKFTATDRKVFVLVETGTRMHITTYVREKPKVPSQFTLKLRKHVRSWRLENVSQLGADRIVDMTFGVGDTSHHFVLEFFAKGNFILTDHSYNIMMLLRTHKDEDVRYFVRERYPTQIAADYTPATHDVLEQTFKSAPPESTVKNVLTSLPYLAPSLVDHLLSTCAIAPTTRANDLVAADSPAPLAAVLDCLRTVCDMFEGKSTGAGICYRQSGDDSAFLDFSPLELAQYQTSAFTPVVYPTLCEAMDKYFYRLENAQVVSHNEKQASGLSKKDKFLKDHERRLKTLKNEEDRNKKKAMLIQSNVEDVDAAIKLIQGVLATGIAWDELKAVLKARQREGHPIANIIHELRLERNAIAVLLTEDADELEEEDADLESIVVEIDLGKSAYANANSFFTAKKANATKVEKTVAATSKAMNAAQKKGEREQKKKAPKKKELAPMRKQYWFEKFLWFITSLGRLVIAGHDSQQNEVLVKRYLKKGDLYLHADIHGAASCVLKNPSCDPVPLNCLREAGAFTVCHSKAWETKTAVSAWWVYSNQVSKSAAAGDYIATGSFIIKGKKNYLAPQPLSLGAALLFRISQPRERSADADGAEIEATGGSVPGEPADAEEPEPVMDRASTEDTLFEDDSTPSTMQPRSTNKKKRTSVKDRGSRKSETSESSDQSAKKGVDIEVSSTSGTSHKSSDVGVKLQGKGKKHKWKKIQSKYAEQDDEDRARAMALIGNPLSAIQQQMLELEKARKGRDKEPPDEEVEEATKPQPAGTTSPAPKKEVKFHDELIEEHAGVRKRHDTKEEDEERIAQRIDSELQELPYLTGNPQPDDDIEYAIPICAPLSTVLQYKYRVKITVGPEKKGNAASHAVAILNATAAGAPDEPFVKAVDLNDVVQQFIGHAKVHNDQPKKGSRHSDPMSRASTSSDML